MFVLVNASFGYRTDVCEYERLQQAVDHGRVLQQDNDCRYQVWRQPADGSGELETLVWDTRDDA